MVANLGYRLRIDLQTIEMSHAHAGAYIAICTFHTKNSHYQLHCNGVTTYLKDNVMLYIQLWL